MSGMLGGVRSQLASVFGFAAADPGHEPNHDQARRVVQSQIGAARGGGSSTELLVAAAVYPCGGSPTVLAPVAMRAALGADAPKLARHVCLMFN